MAWPRKVKENLLVRCGRHCCICNKFCAAKIEIHHIIPESEGGATAEDNGIPVCFDCHADIKHYNDKHPRGTKFSPGELRRHRERLFNLVKTGRMGREHDVAGRLSIVALDILEAEPAKVDQFPTLDVVFRNTGEVAVITETIFRIRAVYEAKRGWLPGAIMASWKYHVCLPILGAGSDVGIAIRQEVPSNGSDRFQFILGNDAPPTLSAFLFEASVEFIYDEDRKRLRSQAFLFIASPPIEIHAMNDGGDFWGAYVHNVKIIRLVDGFDGIVSGAAQQWIDEGKQFISQRLADFAGEDLNKRRFLAEGFGRLGYEGRTALPALREAMDSADPELSELARRSILRIEQASRDTAPPVIDPDIHSMVKGWIDA
ncbi:MAG TPA: HNH endonuclease signature motif containing protein [Pirellulaceae bacterium]|nr:HNH endonuclease signature motif containing protein [Pirellulaceae bacterium]